MKDFRNQRGREFGRVLETFRCNVKCNIKLRKLLSAHKSHVRETSLLTGAKTGVMIYSLPRKVEA